MSNWQVILLKAPESYLSRLSGTDRSESLNALGKLQKMPLDSNYKKLQGRDEWCLRVRQRRILFKIDKRKKCFVVTKIGPRGDIYK